MASSSGGGVDSLNPTARDELKSQFSTREGLYRLVSALEISRSIRPPPLPYGTLSTATTQPAGPCPPFRLTFVELSSSSTELTESTSPSNRISNGEENHRHRQDSESDCALTDKFVFNYGKELYVYDFTDSRKITDVNKPIDKRVYKGTFPSCHDFNQVYATQDNLSLLIGFSGGQIQLVDPISKEVNKLYNEDRSIDKTRVTCIRWVPNSKNMFFVSHGSGHVYLYNVELSCGTTPPHYQNLKQGPGYTISNVKTKTPRNPITRWVLGEGAINEFAFSPCGHYWASVSQDGFLRIFRCETHELEGITRSYFGGLICVCWSPDSKYICVGGEDDLVTVWSFKERRVVARGQGHKSWISVVAFDPYTTVYDENDGIDELYSSHENETCRHNQISSNNTVHSASNDCHSSGVFSSEPLSGSTSKKQTCQALSNSGSPPHVPSNSSINISKRRSSAINQVSYISNSSDPTAVKSCAANRFSRPPSENLNSSLRLSVSEASGTRVPACYRVGSVGQDTQLCLWDLTEDILKCRPTTSARTHGVTDSTCNHSGKTMNNSRKSNGGSPPQIPTKSIIGNCISSSSASIVSHSSFPSQLRSNPNRCDKDDVDSANTSSSITTQSEGSKFISFGSKKGSNSSTTENGSSSQSNSSSGHGILSLRLGGLVGFGSDKGYGKEHKRNFSLGSTAKNNNHGISGGSNSKANNGIQSMNLGLGLGNLNFIDPLKLIGTEACPRLDECPLLEPLICKKISHERLTALIFREESIVTACQDGVICTWCRPGEELRASSSAGGASNVALQLRNKNLAQDETFSYNNDVSSSAVEQL